MQRDDDSTGAMVPTGRMARMLRMGGIASGIAGGVAAGGGGVGVGGGGAGGGDDDADELTRLRAQNNELWRDVRYTREAVLDSENVDLIASKAARQAEKIVQVSFGQDYV